MATEARIRCTLKRRRAKKITPAQNSKKKKQLLSGSCERLRRHNKEAEDECIRVGGYAVMELCKVVSGQATYLSCGFQRSRPASCLQGKHKSRL